jgi:hypothetical protein
MAPSPVLWGVGQACMCMGMGLGSRRACHVMASRYLYTGARSVSWWCRSHGQGLFDVG